MKPIFSTLTLSAALFMGLHSAYALPQGAPNPDGPNATSVTPKQIEQIQQNKKAAKQQQTAEMMQQLNDSQKVLPNLQTDQ